MYVFLKEAFTDGCNFGNWDRNACITFIFELIKLHSLIISNPQGACSDATSADRLEQLASGFWTQKNAVILEFEDMTAFFIF